MSSPEYQQRWREANKERIRATQKAYREANVEVLRARKRAHHDRVKEARNARTRADRRANPEKYNNDQTRAAKTAQRRLRHSKFDATTYQAALVLQGHKCAICGADLTTLPKHRVHADHCHATGVPRGVLCGDCNMGLGLFKDSPERLQAAVAYLANYPLGIL